MKVYLNRGMEEPEIRRFSINEEVSSSYETFLAKIKSIFLSVQGKKLHVYWKDADEELVAISSDEELIQAIDSAKDGVFHIYLQIDDTSAENVAEDGNGGDGGPCRPPILDGFSFGFEQLGGRGRGFHLFAGGRGGFAVRGMSRGMNRGHPYNGRGRGCGPMSHGGHGMGGFDFLGFGDPRMGCGSSMGHDVFGAGFHGPVGHDGRAMGFGRPQRGFGIPRMGFYIPRPLMPGMVGQQF